MPDEGNANDHDPRDDEPREEGREAGPQRRLRAFAAERFARPHAKDEDDVEPAGAPAMAAAAAASEEPTPPPPPDFYHRRVREYRQRQVRAAGEAPDRPAAPAAAPTPTLPGFAAAGDDDGEDEGGEEPATPGAGFAPPQPPQPPPANNWVPIGPSVLRQGQVSNQTATSGRVAGLAVTAGAARIYAAAANGGVWRSDDQGRTWRSTMDAWDLDPTTTASDSLACGAVAVDPADPDRVYVGSGEGATVWISGGAVVTTLAFLGVGPIRSDDGGSNWQTEPATPALDGQAFYRLAVDPGDRERVVGATTRGIYRREPDGAGGFRWDRKCSGVITAVVAARAGTTTTFYAAQWGGGVFRSHDGAAWTGVDPGFPTASVGRVSLAVLPDNPEVVYALVANSANFEILGVWRLDGGTGSSARWRQISGHPGDLFNGQGFYDHGIAIDPNDVDRLYLGGGTRAVPSLPASDPDRWSSSMYRCAVSASGSGSSLSYSMVPTYIGATVHADVHALAFTPGSSSQLWVGCDGGVFVTGDAGGAADFEARNTGLATLTMEHLSQHPSEDAVLFCGTQDNGTVRFTGEEAWLHMAPGDGGFSVVDWDDPYRVLVTYVYTQSTAVMRRFTDGGTRDSYVDASKFAGDNAEFYFPLVGTPPNPAVPAQANRVAFGSNRPWISDDFGTSWSSIPAGNTSDRLGSNSNPSFNIRSLVFAAFGRLFVGTMNGRVFRYDEGASGWSRTRIDNLGGAETLPATFALPVTDIAVDPADASGGSIYITFGGLGDFRRVWHWNGSRWRARGGPSAGHPDSLLDVQHSAIAVDPANPGRLYVGADIGCWRSTDGGDTWRPFSEGLPDAGVFDLLLHPGRRLLRAATHGRGVFERRLTAGAVRGVELYVRDTQLDQGRFTTVNGLDDPADQGEVVRHWRGPDIKLDTPDAAGQYQLPLTGTLDFYQFVDRLSDDSRGVATHATATITTRVYVQVHNRGVTTADNVRVMLLLANASAGLPPLPAGYDVSVRNGTAINTADWKTVGIVTVDGVRVGFPQIAAFDLRSNMLPPPASLAGNDHHCVLALVHHADDPYNSVETRTDLNSRQQRKAAHKNLKVVQFTGTLPAPAPVMMPLRIHNADLEERLRTGLRIRLHGYRGRVRLLLPTLELDGVIGDLFTGVEQDQDFDDFDRWHRQHLEMIERNQASPHPYNADWCRQRREDVEKARATGFMLAAERDDEIALRGIVMEPGSRHTLFLMLDRPRGGEIGETFDIDLVQLDEAAGEVIGGLDLRLELVPEPEVEQYYLRLWTHRWQWASVLVFARLYDGEGERVTPAADAEVRLVMTRSDGSVEDVGGMRWHGSWKTYYHVLRQTSLSPGAHLRATAWIAGRQVAEAVIEL